MNAGITAINEEVKNASAFVQPLLGEMSKVVIGQKTLVERLIIRSMHGCKFFQTSIYTRHASC